MPVATLILIAKLYVEQLLLLWEWIVVVVGIVVALRFAIAVSYRSIGLMTIVV